MTTYLRPPQCSEREVGGYEDCVWCTGVMLRNAWLGAPYAPSTRAEYEALRVAGGDGPAENPGDGSSQTQQQAGMAKRYGVQGTLVPVGTSWATMRANLRPGTAASVTGRMGNFPSGHRLRRWDPKFVGGHDVFVLIEDGGPVWWMNPAAPNSFQGEHVTWGELEQFYSGFNGGGHYGPAKVVPAAGDDMPPIAQRLVGQVATVAGPSDTDRANIRSAPRLDAKVLRTAGKTNPETWWPLAWALGQVDPATGSDQWLMQLNGTTFEYTAKGNVRQLATPVEPPAPVPDCGPQVEAARAQAKAAEYARVTQGATIKQTIEFPAE